MVLQETRRLEGGRRLREGARSQPPLVSIVTVVFRAARELPPLLESILAHRDQDTEWIVIDGGSDDGTLEILRRYEDAIDYWLSEPDSGIYDAMNKGVAAATGHYILHLNAGDRLRKIPRQELEACMSEKIDLASFAVDVECFGIHRPRPNRFMSRFALTSHHQGGFYRREGHLGYDTQYPIHADFDLNQRMMIAGKTIRCFHIIVSEMGTGGISSTRRTYRENYRLIRRNFGLPYVWIAFVWLRVSRIIPPLKRVQESMRRLLHRAGQSNIQQ